jgi:hypothetical protein
VDRKAPAAGEPLWRGRSPVQPRRNNGWLVAVSGLLFLAWLAVLMWLALH